MTISKSSRHSKIAGDYFESLILYNLSKYGFECSIVDHTGIDIIAKNPKNNELWGISVKDWTRTSNKANATVTFKFDNKIKIEDACEAFNCDQAYFAICIDANNKIIIYLLTLEHLLKKYTPPSQKQFSWNMSSKAKKEYENDPDIKILTLSEDNNRWIETNSSP